MMPTTLRWLIIGLVFGITLLVNVVQSHFNYNNNNEDSGYKNYGYKNGGHGIKSSLNYNPYQYRKTYQAESKPLLTTTEVPTNVDIDDVDEFICPSYYFGKLVHPKFCRKFINCFNGKGFVHECESGKFFDSIRMECDYSDNVICLKEQLPELSKPLKILDQYSSSSAAAAASDEYQTKIRCNQNNGPEEHPFNCGKFLNCANGIAYIQDCGPGTLFNIDTLICDWPQNVNCGYRKISNKQQNTNDNNHNFVDSSYNSENYDDQLASSLPTGYDTFLEPSWNPSTVVTEQQQQPQHQPSFSRTVHGRTFGEINKKPYNPNHPVYNPNTNQQNYPNGYEILPSPKPTVPYYGEFDINARFKPDYDDNENQQEIVTPANLNVLPIEKTTEQTVNLYGERSHTSFHEEGNNYPAVATVRTPHYVHDDDQPIDDNYEGIFNTNEYSNNRHNYRNEKPITEEQILQHNYHQNVAVQPSSPVYPYFQEPTVPLTMEDSMKFLDTYSSTRRQSTKPKFSTTHEHIIPIYNRRQLSPTRRSTTTPSTPIRQNYDFDSSIEYLTTTASSSEIAPIVEASLDDVQQALKLLFHPYMKKTATGNDENDELEHNRHTQQILNHMIENENVVVVKPLPQVDEPSTTPVPTITPRNDVEILNENVYSSIAPQYHQSTTPFTVNKPFIVDQIENIISDEQNALNAAASESEEVIAASRGDVNTAISNNRQNELDKNENKNYGIKNKRPKSPSYTGGWNQVAKCQKDSFDCQNQQGLCISKEKVCDGRNDCGNRLDEKYCDHIGYQARLSGEEGKAHMGRVEIRVYGRWGYVCDDEFDMRDATVLCHELGFTRGAKEIRRNSYYKAHVNMTTGESDTTFIMDKLRCSGNESSLRECEFPGWGIHNCDADEIVGVVCQVSAMKCPKNYFLCEATEECIPFEYVCDGVKDCGDGFEESAEVCSAPIEYRLGGESSIEGEGRAEVKYHTVWGTICDDDFTNKEADVFCRSLGYFGPSSIIKTKYYPESDGPIWLDQMACTGTEARLDECMHFPFGQQNCNHTEDISIKCTRAENEDLTIGESNNHALFQTEPFRKMQQQRMPKTVPLAYVHDGQCGQIRVVSDDENELDNYDEPRFRVINGNLAKEGFHPWQATLRVCGVTGNSVHWCGAVIIDQMHIITAAHCLNGYMKSAYLVRVGDHNSAELETTEMEAMIDDYFIHEEFKKTHRMNNDIALVTLKTPLIFSEHIQPICLPSEDVVYTPGRNCTISGWGSTFSGQKNPALQLRSANIPLIPDEVCQSPDVYNNTLTDGMFCAGYLDDNNVDTCEGDSGGPLVCEEDGTHSLFGIISWGHRCGDANKPGVYVKIREYLPWIQEKLNAGDNSL